MPMATSCCGVPSKLKPNASERNLNAKEPKPDDNGLSV
jgi:hypothetical protein